MNKKRNNYSHITISLAFLGALLMSIMLPDGFLRPREAMAAAITCSSGVSGCHFKLTVKDGTARNVPDGRFIGSHARHAGYSTASAKRQYNYACTKCHPSGSYNNSHQTGYKNITGSSLPGNRYSAGKKIPNTYTPAFGNCSNIYCHSTGRGTNMGQVQYSSARWGGTETCLGCHGGRSTAGPNYYPARSVGNFTLSTTHSQHLKYPAANINCQMCHAKTTQTDAWTLKTYTAATHHVNGVRDVTFTDIAYGSYTSYKSPESGSIGTSKTCNNTSCHGGKSRSAWSATAQNTNHTCAHCHGVYGTTVAAGNADKRLFAPGFRKAGTSTDQNYSSSNRRVGSHFKHLSSVYMKNIKCNECHKVPSTPFSADTNHTLNTLRFNSATLTFDQASTAKWNGANLTTLSAFNGYTNGTATKAATCSSTYCHGNRLKLGDTAGTYRKPYWNYSSMINYTNPAVACTRCHGVPPGTASSQHSGATLTGGPNPCSKCHGSVVNSSGVITNKTLHINGLVEAAGGHEYGFGGSKHMPGGTGSIQAVNATPLSNCGCHNVTTGGSYPVGAARGSATAIVCTVCHWNNPNFYTTGSVGCGDCHGTDALLGRPNGGLTFPNYSGSHSAHAAQAMVCADCHGSYGSGNKTHGNYSGNKKTAFTNISVKFNTTKSGTAAKWNNGGGILANTTCTTSDCHGQKSPAWGQAVPAPQCARCHGYQNLATLNNFTSNVIAPGTGNIDTNRVTGTTGNYTPRGGMHQEHLKATTGMSRKVRCIECHVSTTTVDHSSVLDNSTTASVTFSGVATSLSHTTASASRVSGIINCSNNECHHGGARADGTGAGQSGIATRTLPKWNESTLLGNTSIADTCTGKCHNMPPGGATGGGDSSHGSLSSSGSYTTPAQLATTCSGCHNVLSASATTLANLWANQNAHINGIVDAASGCGGCHNALVGGSPSPANSRRQVVASGVNNGEFTVTAGTKYTNMTSHVKTSAMADKTCEFCHAYSTRHKNAADNDGVKVLLQRTDAPGQIAYTGSTASLTPFCAGCHRSAGYGGTIPSGATGTATQPYKDSNDLNSPDDIFGVWSSSGQRSGVSATSNLPTVVAQTHRKSAQCMDCHGNYVNDTTTTPRINAHASNNGKFLRYSTNKSVITPNGTFAESQTCFNRTSGCHGPGSTLYAGARVFSEFKSNNASAGGGGAHPILAAVVPKSTRISADNTGVNFVRGWKANSVATCSDCHGATRTGPRGPHGSANAYLLQDLDTTSPGTSTSGVTLGTPAYSTGSANTKAFCLNCHAMDVYGNGNGSTQGSRAGNRFGHGSVSGYGSNCANPAANPEGYNCKSCHCGKGSNATQKGTHSTNAPLASTISNLGFTNGNCWSAAPVSGTACYSEGLGNTSWSSCGQSPHDSSDVRYKRDFADISGALQKIMNLGGASFRERGVQDGLPVLIETMKSQQRMIESQRNDLIEIKRMIRQME